MLSGMAVRTMLCARGLLLMGSLLACAADPAHAADWRMGPAGSKLEYIAMLQKVRVSRTFKDSTRGSVLTQIACGGARSTSPS
jgi:hypothetical protein